MVVNLELTLGTLADARGVVFTLLSFMLLHTFYTLYHDPSLSHSISFPTHTYFLRHHSKRSQRSSIKITQRNDINHHITNGDHNHEPRN